MPTIAYDAASGTAPWPTEASAGVDEPLTLLVLRLRAPLGGYRADTTIGLPYDAWAERRPSIEAVSAAVRDQVERDDRLTVRALEVTVDGGTISVSLQVDVTADAGRVVTAQVAGTLYGVSGVSTWYVTGMIGVSR